MPKNTPGHLLPLANGWSLWKDFCVRGAGFPASDVLRLGSPELASAVDAWLDLEERGRALRAEVVATLERIRKGLPQDGARVLNNAIRTLARGGMPQNLPAAGDEARASFEALRSSLAEREAGRERLDALFEHEGARLGELLRALAREPRFREAVLWQNRNAVHSGLDVLLRSPPTDRSARNRAKEQLVTNYLQRYTVKNDSIGYFGPFGWGTFSEEGPIAMARPGPSLVETRWVTFDFWTMEAIAQVMTRIPGVRPWLAPRLMPAIRIEGQTMFMPLGTDELQPPMLRVLTLCRGELLARDIAATVVAEGLYASEADVYTVMDEQVTNGVLVWEVELPTRGRDAQVVLRQVVERISDETARSAALAPLVELEEAREAIMRAAGNPDALDRALGELESLFTRLTTQASTRNAGKTYGGRTLLFEDCRRDLTLTFGPGLMDRIRRPLSLLLQSGRWYSYHLARVGQEAMVETFRTLCESLGGTDTLEGMLCWPTIVQLFPGGKAPPFAEAHLEEYPARWARIFGLPRPPGQRVVAFTSDELEPLVRDLFAAPHPGWPTARFHSPDLMLSARSQEAIQRGDFQVVMGELHFILNSLEQEALMETHPDPERLRVAIAEDVGPRAAPTVMKTEVISGRGITPFTEHPEDVAVEYDAARSWRPRSQVVSLGDMVVRLVDGRIKVFTRDGSRHWDMMQLMEGFFTDIPVPLLPQLPYIPRITIDGLVVARETWRFPVADLPFVQAATATERFIGTRRWARDHGMPRFLFFKSSSEKKPSYLDLESPHSVDNFLRMLFEAKTVSVSEMLPDVDHTWLPDAQGHTFTSEFRIVAVDPERWRPE